MININEYLMSKSTNKETLKKTSDPTYAYEQKPMSKQEAWRSLLGKPSGSYGRLEYEMTQKLRDWNAGKRKENVKACKDAKLIVYYYKCEELGFRDQMEALENEANRRGWTFFTKDKKEN